MPGTGPKPRSNTCKPRNPYRHGAHGNPTDQNTLPRISSVEGVTARFDLRIKHFPGKPGFRKPGSVNPRKVGR